MSFIKSVGGVISSVSRIADLTHIFISPTISLPSTHSETTRTYTGNAFLDHILYQFDQNINGVTTNIEIFNGDDSSNIDVGSSLLYNLYNHVNAYHGYYLAGGNDTFHGGSSSDNVFGGNGNDILYGDSDNDRIEGGDGNDYLNGEVGADDLRGGEGDDQYILDSVADKVVEAADAGVDVAKPFYSYTILSGNVENVALMGSGNTSATGHDLANVLIGNSGNNTLSGRGGNDTLRGGDGIDSFFFSTGLGSTNVDYIADFVAEDHIYLDNAIFSALPLGWLQPTAFKNIATGAADANDRILYDSDTGDIYYDADGSGAGASFRLARLLTQPTMTAAEFYVI
jgi:Ca2+-binding RTX toxin-like protein